MLFRVNTFSSGDWNTCDVFNEKILNKKVFNINFCCLCYKTNFTQSSEGIIWSEIFHSSFVWSFCWNKTI